MASVSLYRGFLSTSTPNPKLNERNAFGKHVTPALPKHALSPIKELLPVKKVFTEYLYELNDTSNNYYSYQEQQSGKNAVRKLFNAVLKCDLTTSSENDSGIQCSTLSTLSNSENETCISKNTNEKSNILSYSSSLSIKDYTLEKDSSLSLKITKSRHDSIFKADKSNYDLNSVATRKSLVHVSQKSNLDIFLELKEMNCYLVLSQILSYLSAKEICNVSFVSKSWREIVVEDKLADERRNDYLNQKKKAVFGPNKENRLSSAVRKIRDHKNVFRSMINIPSENAEKPSDLLNSKSRHQSFLDVGTTLEMNDKLLKCPKCQYPAKCEKGSKYCCTRNFCQYSFCSICKSPYIGSHKCSIPSLSENVPKIIVGSKQSKKNLKRL